MAALLLPALLALVVFANTLAGTFVYDDRDLLVQNPRIHSLTELPSAFTTPMWGFRTSAPTNYYRPVPIVVYTLLWVVGGGSPWPFHLLNVLLHAANAALAAGLVQRLSRNSVLAAAAGALFAVHPLVTEVVAWASCLPELLYAGAVLGFLHLHLARAPGRRGLAWGAAGLLLLGLLSKEAAIAAIPLALCLDWTRGERPGAAVRRLLAYLPPVALVLAARQAVLGGLAPKGSGSVGLWEGLIAAPRILLHYLGLLIAPQGLTAHHLLPPGWAQLRLLFGAGAALLLAVAAVRAIRHRSGAAMAAALVVLPLLPVLYVPLLGATPIAERYAYLSVFGMAWVVLGLAAGRPRRLALVAAALVLPAAAASFARNFDWRNDRVLAEAILRAEPRAEPAYLMLGKWFWDRGESDAAIEVFRRGVETLPDNPTLRASLLVSRWSLGRVPAEEAIPALESLAAARPEDAMLQYNLGEAYLRTGKIDDADASFARALQARPACSECLVGRAVVAARRGDPRSSVRLAREALSLAPGDVPARLQLGIGLLRLGDTGAALQALEEASRLAPRNAEVWNARGAALASAGRLAAAADAWERALALDPALDSARRNLERLRARAPERVATAGVSP